MTQRALLRMEHGAPVGVEVDDRIAAEHFEQGFDVGRFDQAGCGLERVEPGDRASGR